MFNNKAANSLLGGGAQSSTILRAPTNQYGVQSSTGAGLMQPGTANSTVTILKPGESPAQTDSALTPTGLTSPIDPAAAAASAKVAADAARASQLRGDITNIANRIKDIFNSRYSQVDASANEQTGKLNDRFATESKDVATQVEGENAKLGAAHAASGSFDSSYRGNNVDTVTQAGDAQVRDLGTELQDNIAKIASYVTSQRAGFDAQKGGMDSILAHLGESTDPAELLTLRNSLDGRIAELNSGSADNNTAAQNRGALEAIAPSSARSTQLKTTLSQIVAGNADNSQKAAIGQRLIQSAGLSPEDQQALLSSFQGDLQKKEQTTA